MISQTTATSYLKAMSHPELPLASRLSNTISEQIYTQACTSYQKKQYREAEKLFAELLASDQLQPLFWFGLASCLQQQGEAKNALCAWNKSLIIDTKNAAPCFHAAECWFALGSFEEALDLLDLATKRLAHHKNPLIWEKKIERFKERWTILRRDAS